MSVKLLMVTEGKKMNCTPAHHRVHSRLAGTASYLEPPEGGLLLVHTSCTWTDVMEPLFIF